MNEIRTFWSMSAPELISQLGTSPNGLPSEAAWERLQRYGAKQLRPKRQAGSLSLLLGQFRSPIILILLFAAGLSFFLHDHTNAIIILTIVLASGLLGFWQERGAVNAVAKLLARVQIRAAVLRDGERQEIPVEEVVPGDIVILNAGDVVPGDCLILESRDLFVDEAALTGENYPAEKMAGILAPETPLARRTNALFMGTHVISGTAKAVVVHIGADTEFGRISRHLKLRPPETNFEHGVRGFGYLLMEITLILVIAVFAINVYFERPILDSFLFSLALAVGLTPQLLPAIIGVNLAHGASRMAKEKVIVKRLASIENFGTMNVLCCDKTGTLTEGKVQVHNALGIDGRENDEVLLLAYLNAAYETGFTNPIDEAIRAHCEFDITNYKKLDEVPYDFIRKRLSILVEKDGARLMITKGAVLSVLSACAKARVEDGSVVDIAGLYEQIQKRFDELSQNGFRVLGIAYRYIGLAQAITKADETGMTFLGFVVLSDPLKPGITASLNELRNLGISLKIITGDSQLVARSVSLQVGIADPKTLTGSELDEMTDAALFRRVSDADVFAEVEPRHKERIITALRRAGNVVGFLGDGINDAPALRAADVGISVDGAVDVAKEAADIVLLQKDLAVLADGVQEGRKTFANTLKYVFMAASANFGNMFSIAGASLFLPFLPLLPTQILLANLLTDLPEMTIATDDVDREMVEAPQRWDIRFIRRFMVVFGLVSSIFDYLTFGVLLLVLQATEAQFRTGWFMESVISAAVIVLVIRTRRPFFRSKPGTLLILATLLVVAATLGLPFTSLGRVFGFVPPEPWLIPAIGAILCLYVIAAELAKKLFYKRTSPKDVRG